MCNILENKQNKAKNNVTILKWDCHKLSIEIFLVVKPLFLTLKLRNLIFHRKQIVWMTKKKNSNNNNNNNNNPLFFLLLLNLKKNTILRSVLSLVFIHLKFHIYISKF